MKTILSILAIFLLSPSCSDQSTSTEQEIKAKIVKSWRGEEFFLITIDDSTFLGRDFVGAFDFKNDGTYFRYNYSWSSLGRYGTWNLEAQSTKIRLAESDTFEVFQITVLTSTLFVIGDTTSRGFKLVPSPT